MFDGDVVEVVYNFIGFRFVEESEVVRVLGMVGPFVPAEVFAAVFPGYHRYCRISVIGEIAGVIFIAFAEITWLPFPCPFPFILPVAVPVPVPLALTWCYYRGLLSVDAEVLH